MLYYEDADTGLNACHRNIKATALPLSSCRPVRRVDYGTKATDNAPTKRSSHQVTKIKASCSENNKTYEERAGLDSHREPFVRSTPSDEIHQCALAMADIIYTSLCLYYQYWRAEADNKISKAKLIKANIDEIIDSNAIYFIIAMQCSYAK